MPGFLELLLGICLYVYMFVCASTPKAITSGMILSTYDIDTKLLVK